MRQLLDSTVSAHTVSCLCAIVPSSRPPRKHRYPLLAPPPRLNLLNFLGLSRPNRAMQPRCAMRFESHTPKSLAMRKSFSASDAKTHSLDLKSQEMPEKSQRKSCDVGLRCGKSGCFSRSSDANFLRFGLSLRFGLRCKRPRCQIASDVGRAMRTTKFWAKHFCDWEVVLSCRNESLCVSSKTGAEIGTFQARRPPNPYFCGDSEGQD